MRFRIHYTLPDYGALTANSREDSVIVSGDTIEEIREKATREVEKRGGSDPWSEEI